jgi:2-isopropylmalate synthase
VSTDRRSYATVRISWGGRDHAEAEAEGNGPMDALFRATDAAVGVRGGGHGPSHLRFRQQRYGRKGTNHSWLRGPKVRGTSSSPDAVEAAAHAYLRTVAAYLSDEVPSSSTE